MPTPAWVPPPGFYYHYKRSRTDDIDVGAYEVLGIGVDSETDELEVEYRPLYAEGAITLKQRGVRCYHRDLSQFLEEVRKGRGRVPRFKKITDEDTVEKLAWIRDQLYDKAASK